MLQGQSHCLQYGTVCWQAVVIIHVHINDNIQTKFIAKQYKAMLCHTVHPMKLEKRVIRAEESLCSCTVWLSTAASCIYYAVV